MRGTEQAVLTVSDAIVDAPGGRRRARRLLHGVSFEIGEGETLGLVGESGAGKTSLGRAVLGLLPLAAGTIAVDGVPVSPSRRRRAHPTAPMHAVFQDPLSSLNPTLRAQDTLMEPLLARRLPRIEQDRRTRELLDLVGLPAAAADRLPHEFSGGQRQRLALARALAHEPRLIVCDEPVSALDLTTQANILDLLIGIQERTGIALLFISHDLAVIRRVSHRVAVMHEGRIVETGDVERICTRPDHPRTKALLAASLIADPVRQRARRAG